MVCGLITLGHSLRAQDVFDASPEVRVVRRQPAPSRNSESSHSQRSGPRFERADHIKLLRGEMREVLRTSKMESPQPSFYLPPEATRFVQLVAEKHMLEVRYFLKARDRGKTVGGIVERRWLDSEGFAPKTASDEARIQQAIRANPVFIEVK